ncbi:MAG TPA: glycosyltransferase family 4 protein [Chloroflexota bacterium]|nr:glycosyltransferase family 4 protein [Chloroflexota bacterium]
MRIAQVAPPFETVPPSRYGGTERVVATLTEELVRRGHDVTLFAAGDSVTSARLVPTVESALWHQKPRPADFNPYWAMTLGEVWRRIDEFDIVHSHLDYFGYPMASAGIRPVVTTLHGRLDLPDLTALYRNFNDVPLVSISDAQRVPIPDANWAATIYHGIELGQYTFNPRMGGYLAFLGRISPEKGLDTAIRVARRAGVPLLIGARMPLPHMHDPNVQADWLYWENEVQPLLEGKQVELLGQLDGHDKNELLRGAAGLLFPIRWPEPFGLVMVEAMACGTPVLALREGSVPEIVDDGVTGFIRDTEDELVDAVKRIADLDRARCRADVERRFSPAAMTDAYEEVYERVVQAHESRPRLAA